MFLKYVFFLFILDAIFCCTIFFSFLRTPCGLLRNLDVFIVFPFVNSTKLAIVAEAVCSAVIFCPKKGVVTYW